VALRAPLEDEHAQLRERRPREGRDVGALAPSTASGARAGGAISPPHARARPLRSSKREIATAASA
jgi:hypothetical protein